MDATHKQIPINQAQAKDILGDNWCDYAKAAQQVTTSEQLIALAHNICEEQKIDPYACCLGLMLALGSKKEFEEFCCKAWGLMLTFLNEFLGLSPEDDGSKN